MADRTTKNVFVTLTFKDGQYSEEIQNHSLKLVEKMSDRYCAVRETGSYGTNPHIHIYMELGQARRTDNITTMFKKLYKKSNVIANRFTVKTIRELDPIYRVGYYMQKEPNHVKLDCGKIEWKVFSELFEARKSLSLKLVKEPNFKKLKIDEIPTAYLAYCDSHKLDRNNINENIAKMIYDDLIQVTQFRALRAVKLKILIKLDRGEHKLYINDIMDLR